MSGMFPATELDTQIEKFLLFLRPSSTTEQQCMCECVCQEDVRQSRASGGDCTSRLVRPASHGHDTVKVTTPGGGGGGRWELEGGRAAAYETPHSGLVLVLGSGRGGGYYFTLCCLPRTK